MKLCYFANNSELTRSGARHQEGVSLLHSPHSPCGRGCHSKERQFARLVWGTAYDNGLLRLMLHSVRYSTFPLTTPFALSALWKKSRYGADPTKTDR